MRLLFIALLVAVGAPQAGAAALCDTIASRVRADAGVGAGARTVWALVTSGRQSFVEVAGVSGELSLEREPAPDERVQFEKRIRARYGNAEAVLRDLRAWDNFDIVELPGSQVRMLLTTGGTAQCESRYFFRVTTSRDVVRVPDPPARSASDFANAICQNLGGWGYFARVGGAEAFVEYHTTPEQESLRIVPLTDAGWQPACTVSAKFRVSPATAQRDRLEEVTSGASK